MPRPAANCAALPDQPPPLPTRSTPALPVPSPRSVPLPQPSKQKRKFSSFFKSLVIELDKDLYGPDNHLVEVRPRALLPLNSLPPCRPRSHRPQPGIREPRWACEVTQFSSPGQWHRTPTTQETDGFQVKRPGDLSVRCTLLLMLDYQVRAPRHPSPLPGQGDQTGGPQAPHTSHPRSESMFPRSPTTTSPRYVPSCLALRSLHARLCLTCMVTFPQPPQFKLDPRLARLLGLHTQSRSAIVQALWQYVKTNRLQDSHDKEYINGDKYFQQVPSLSNPGPRGAGSFREGKCLH